MNKSDRDLVALVFTERWKRVWKYDRIRRRWLENGEVERGLQKVFRLIVEISRELKIGPGSATFVDSVRRYLQNAPEFAGGDMANSEVSQCPASV